MFQTLVGGLLPLSAAVAVGLVLTVPVACAESTAPVLDVQQMIAEAIAAGQHTVTLPAGHFQLATPNVKLRNVHDLTIEGAGQDQTVLLAGVQGMFDVADCQRITFRNFAIDSDPLPFTQATLTKISEAADKTLSIDFQVHAGYPTLTDRFMSSLGQVVFFWDPETRQLKRGAHGFHPVAGKNVVRLDDTHGRLLLGPEWKGQFAEGDYVTLKLVPNNGGGPFQLVGDDTTRLENVTILSTYYAGVSAWCLTGDNYFRFTIKAGPTPAGATEARLLGTNQDGMQYRCCPGALTLEGCDLGPIGDDGLWVATFGEINVVEVQSPTRFQVTLPVRLAFLAQRIVSLSQPGDIVRPERPGTCEPLGDLPLQSLVYQGPSPQGGDPLFTVELQRAPATPVAVGDHLILRKFLPEHFTIRNCHFHDGAARGVTCFASNGVIENNTFERIAHAGIWLGEYEGPGGGADWVSNVVVRNNVIRDVSWPKAGGGAFGSIAALLVWSQNDSPGALPFNRNLSLVGNTIDDCAHPGILISGLDGGEVRDNVVKNTNQDPGTVINVGPKSKVPAPYGITLMNSKNVVVEGNEVSGLGADALGAVGDVGTFPATEQVGVPGGGS